MFEPSAANRRVTIIVAPRLRRKGAHAIHIALSASQAYAGALAYFGSGGAAPQSSEWH